jgi:dTDP-3,4-didehydro-2,6-dideoxy-alpha-D-glucose 3-reductase
MTEPVTVALWGVGSHARRNVIPALRAAAGVDVVGVFSRDRSARNWAAKELNSVAYESPETLLNGDAEAVYLATPPATHHAIGRLVLLEGKHLWCEKPLVIDAAAGEDLFRLAEAGEVGIFETLMYLHHPQFNAILDLVGSGSLGTIRSVEAFFGIPHLARNDHRYRPELGGGALSDTSSYPISLISHLLGAELAVLGAAVASEPSYEVDTRGSALLTGWNAASGLASWGFGLSYRNEARVWGSEGCLFVPRAFSKPADFVSDLTITRSDGSTEIVEIGPANHFVSMIECFATDIRRQRQVAHTEAARRQEKIMMQLRAASGLHWPIT